MSTFGHATSNLSFWDERASAHSTSDQYNVPAFTNSPSHLSPSITFDIPLLGSLSGLDIIHLQCHIGTDTLSLARLGAAHVTGLDFSGASIALARALASQTQGSGGEKLAFVHSDIHAASPAVSGKQFDLVFTSVGVLCWLPSIRLWAETVARLLKPGGRLFLREAHPVAWTLEESEEVDERRRDVRIVHSYFEQREPRLCRIRGSYAVAGKSEFETSVTGQWNHGLGEIVQALLDEGLVVSGLREWESMPWRHLRGVMERVEGVEGEWCLREGRERVPLSYTLQAVKLK